MSTGAPCSARSSWSVRSSPFRTAAIVSANDTPGTNSVRVMHSSRTQSSASGPGSAPSSIPNSAKACSVRRRQSDSSRRSPTCVPDVGREAVAVIGSRSSSATSERWETADCAKGAALSACCATSPRRRSSAVTRRFSGCCCKRPDSPATTVYSSCPSVSRRPSLSTPADPVAVGSPGTTTTPRICERVMRSPVSESPTGVRKSTSPPGRRIAVNSTPSWRNRITLSAIISNPQADNCCAIGKFSCASASNLERTASGRFMRYSPPIAASSETISLIRSSILSRR